MDTRADAVVLFGVTGNLVFKKLFPALHELSRQHRLGVPVIGIARSAWDSGRLTDFARKAVGETPGGIDEAAFAALAGDLHMVTGDYADPDTYQRLAAHLQDAQRPVFYLAIPPSVFADVIQGLAAVGLAARGRVIVEKPFGRDAQSARELNSCLAGAFA